MEYLMTTTKSDFDVTKRMSKETKWTIVFQ